MAKELALIDPDLLLKLLNSGDRQHRPVDPTLAAMGQIASKTDATLADTESDPDVRVKKINELLTRYAAIDSQRTPAPALPTTAANRIGDSDVEFILETIPKTFRLKGKALLSHMRRSGVDWNEKGEVSIQGKLLPNSNIADIANNLLRYRKKSKTPANADDVYDALKRNNIPQELVPNPPRKAPLTAKRKVPPSGQRSDDEERYAARATPRARRKLSTSGGKSSRDSSSDRDEWTSPFLITPWKQQYKL